MSRHHPKHPSLWTTALLSLLHVACGSDGGSNATEDPGPTADFQSADPSGELDQASASNGAVGVSSTSGGTDGGDGSGGTGGSSGEGGSDDPGRVIEEADIVKVVGDRLYAMSRYGGVAVIDISNVDELVLMGRHRIDATPFEMYVKDGIVFALYQDYGEYIYDEAEGTASFTQSGQVAVIDAENPAGMNELDRFAIPGAISDSRIVGDILYVAAFENGYCWGCETQPRTTVISLNVSEPAEVAKVDQMSFSDQLDSWGWKRSLSVTDQRMYIAGPEWGPDQPTGSTIQVVDISDPAGDLVEGATVQVAGQINSRWQMDEHEGVLRVITQPFEWDLTVPPSVETFRVNASDDLEALGSLALELPRPEQLQSVRFDGPRGYAITFEQTDPLFTIDLSSPEAPVQAGMLEMPGWLYHMEPRGDRLVGLGFDQENEAGALAVSLFDVSNLEAPKMLDRANFGGDWGWLGEDQDRIHKAFRLFDEAGLIVMPFSGYVYPEAQADQYCYGSWVSGVQLIDWQNDELQSRGVAQMSSEARRGFLHDERLVAVSDERVEVFDISDRDAPARTGNVALAQYVSRTVGAGNRVLRVGQSWYSNQAEVDSVELDQVSTPRSVPSTEVGAETGDSCKGYSYLSDVVASEDRAYLVFSEYDYGSGDSRLRVSTLDVSESDTPKLVGSVEPEISPYYNNADYSLPGMASGVVRVGESLVFNHHDVMQWGDDGLPVSGESGLYVVDLSDPTSARTRYAELPVGRGVTGLFVDGNVVARSHYTTSADDSKSVRFYLERVDVSDPAKPRRLPSLNVPGSVIALSGDRAFTVDFEYRVQEDLTTSECYENARVASFELADAQADRGTCTSIVEVLTLIRFDGSLVKVLGTEKLQPDEAISNVALGDNVMFALVNRPNYYYYGDGLDCYDCFYVNRDALKVLTLAGLSGGELSVGRVELSRGDDWYYGTGLIAASGQRAIVSNGWQGQLTLIDASNPKQPELANEVEVEGYVSHISVVGSTALVSMGYDGVEAISLED